MNKTSILSNDDYDWKELLVDVERIVQSITPNSNVGNKYYQAFLSPFYFDIKLLLSENDELRIPTGLVGTFTAHLKRIVIVESFSIFESSMREKFNDCYNSEVKSSDMRINETINKIEKEICSSCSESIHKEIKIIKKKSKSDFVSFLTILDVILKDKITDSKTRKDWRNFVETSRVMRNAIHDNFKIIKDQYFQNSILNKHLNKDQTMNIEPSEIKQLIYGYHELNQLLHN